MCAKHGVLLSAWELTLLNTWELKYVWGARVAKHRKLGDLAVCSCVEMCDNLMENYKVVCSHISTLVAHLLM